MISEEESQLNQRDFLCFLAGDVLTFSYRARPDAPPAGQGDPSEAAPLYGPPLPPAAQEMGASPRSQPSTQAAV